VQLRGDLPVPADWRQTRWPLAYGECFGALSWIVEAGHAGGVELAGLRAVLVTRYHDDEPGSPWTYALFVDARSTEAQRSAMADIFTGRLGGTARKQFPWVFKDAHLQGVEALEIEIDHTPGRGWFRVGIKVEVRVREPVAGQDTVTCVIPGPPPTRPRVVQRLDRHQRRTARVLGRGTMRLRDHVRVFVRR
jgi:hypothetical protein